MAKKRLTTHERHHLRDMANEALSIREDWHRRLRNALLCLALSDPRWIVWVEREIDPATMDIVSIARLVEIRTRWVILRRYSFFHRGRIGPLIFNDSHYFTDRGNLGPG